MLALQGWDLTEQCRHIRSVVDYWRLIDGRDRYPITDAEMRNLALLVALDNLGGRPGTHRYPSGAAVHVLDGDPDSEGNYIVEGQPVVSDLPEELARLFVRMAPEKQPAGDAELPRLARAEREMHERAARMREEARRWAISR